MKTLTLSLFNQLYLFYRRVWNFSSLFGVEWFGLPTFMTFSLFSCHSNWSWLRRGEGAEREENSGRSDRRGSGPVDDGISRIGWKDTVVAKKDLKKDLESYRVLWWLVKKEELCERTEGTALYTDVKRMERPVKTILEEETCKSFLHL